LLGLLGLSSETVRVHIETVNPMLLVPAARLATDVPEPMARPTSRLSRFLGLGITIISYKGYSDYYLLRLFLISAIMVIRISIYYAIRIISY
jgi:hypothetical protein